MRFQSDAIGSSFGEMRLDERSTHRSVLKRQRAVEACAMLHACHSCKWPSRPNRTYVVMENSTRLGYRKDYRVGFRAFASFRRGH